MKRIIWYDDHFNADDRILIEDIEVFVKNQRVECVEVATQKEFAEVLHNCHGQPSSISGILLDLMLTHDHFTADWGCLGAPHIHFEPYTAGRQVLEILKGTFPSELRFVEAFRNHSTAILTAASDVIVLENIPKSQRTSIPVIFKDGGPGTEQDPRVALRLWIEALPPAT